MSDHGLRIGSVESTMSRREPRCLVRPPVRSAFLCAVLLGSSCTPMQICRPVRSRVALAENGPLVLSSEQGRDWVRSLVRSQSVTTIRSDCGPIARPTEMGCAWFRLSVRLNDQPSSLCVGASVGALRRSIIAVLVEFQRAGGADEQWRERVFTDMSDRGGDAFSRLQLAAHPRATRIRLVARQRVTYNSGTETTIDAPLPDVELLLIRVDESELLFEPTTMIEGSGWSIEFSRWFSTRAACERSLSPGSTNPAALQPRLAALN